MSNRRTAGKMVATKSKNKVLTCSVSDHTLDSPSRDSDSMCDSETASPVPFICTQDGSEGVTDVVWNYYSTNSKNSLQKNSTPISRKSRVPHRLKLPEKELQPTFSKRKATRPSQKKLQLPQELLEFNEYVDKFMEKKIKTSNIVEKPRSKKGSDEDIFNDAGDSSPKSVSRTKRCLRKNVLKTKFSRPESENGLDSDDSINECLLKASQAVEETIFNEVPSKRRCFEANLNPAIKPNMNEDSMDAILRNIRSPYVNKVKCDSPGLKNDSFDNFVENLNDSTIERLSQMPVKNGPFCRMSDRHIAHDSKTKFDELTVHNASPSSRFSFVRHSSMPESPSMTDDSKPTTTMPIGRYRSMPFNDSSEKNSGDSPIRCTPLEIQKKHRQAREKLLAKRLLPFTQTQPASLPLPSKMQTTTVTTHKTESPGKLKFQPKFPTRKATSPKETESILKNEQFTCKQNTNSTATTTTTLDLRSLIEKKRQEALMKLRRRQLQK